MCTRFNKVWSRNLEWDCNSIIDCSFLVTLPATESYRCRIAKPKTGMESHNVVWLKICPLQSQGQTMPKCDRPFSRTHASNFYASHIPYIVFVEEKCTFDRNYVYLFRHPRQFLYFNSFKTFSTKREFVDSSI